MTEPVRMHALPESELERALLNAGRSYTASDATRAQLLASLGLAGAGASSSTRPGSTLTKGALLKGAVALIVAAAIALPVWRYSTHRPSGPPLAVKVPVVTAPPVLQPPPAAVAALPPEALPLEAVPVEALPLEASNAAAVASAAHAEPKPPAAAPLSDELAALDAARTSLSHSDPGAALTALDAYTRNFPRGRLGLEAEVLRISALAKSGQTDAARKRAEAFLRGHPGSVLASRVRGYAGL